MLGLTPQSVWTEQAISLSPGEALLVLSDATRRLLDEQGHPLNASQLAAALPSSCNASAAEIADCVLHYIDEHAHDRSDLDWSLLVIRRR